MALAPCEDDDMENEGTLAFRNEVLARYRQLREISKRHHDEILKFISSDTLLLYHARRLGLAQGKTLIVDNVDELNYAFDLAIHTAAADRKSVV